MFQIPLRCPLKRILSPSGDQSLLWLSPWSKVNWVISPPLLGIIATLMSAPRLISSASSFPSGDQDGQPIISLSKVNWRGAPPSRSCVQTLMVPLLVELNARCFPSGDNLGRSEEHTSELQSRG